MTFQKWVAYQSFGMYCSGTSVQSNFTALAVMAYDSSVYSTP